MARFLFSPDEQNISPSELLVYINKLNNFLFSLDRKKILPSELIENNIFNTHKSTKMASINFISDEQKFVHPDLSPGGPYSGWPLFRMALILDGTLPY